MITKEQIHILKHSLGIRDNEPYRDVTYRNIFADEPTDSLCAPLAEMGLMEQGDTLSGGLVLYHVTKKGRETLKELEKEQK